MTDGRRARGEIHGLDPACCRGQWRGRRGLGVLHLAEAGGEAALAVDQELRRNDDAVPRGQALEDLGPLADRLADLDRGRGEAAVTERLDDAIRSAGADDGRLGHRQDVRPARRDQADRRIHVRLQHQIRIVEAQSELHGPGFRPQVRVDEFDDAGPDPSGHAGDARLGGDAVANERRLAFEDVGDQPNHRGIGDRHRRHVRPDEHPLGDIQGDHGAGARREHLDPVGHLAGLADLLDLPRIDPQRQQLPPGAGIHLGLAALQFADVFPGGEGQVRREDLEHHLALFDRRPNRPDHEALDPAFGADVNVAGARVIVGDDAEGLDGRVERRPLGEGGAHAEVLHHGGRQRDHAIRPIGAVPLSLVHGDQIHPHRRLAGAIAPIVGIHRRDPIEDLRAPSLAARVP